VNATAVPELTFTRVIAALDASCDDAETLAMAVDMAARFGVEVAGLFIEDINLFRLAALPMVRHVTIGSAVAAPLNVVQMETDMRALAARAASELETSASRQGIKWSFRVVRGLPADELTTATMTEDLLVVGATRGIAGMPMRLPSPLRDAVRRAGRSLLHAPRRTPLTRPLVMLWAGSGLTPRTLAAATRLAGGKTGTLDVLLVGRPSETGSAAGEIAAALEAQGYRSRITQIGELTTAQLTRVTRETGSDVLILAADLPGVGTDAELEEFLICAPCQVLVVR